MCWVVDGKREEMQQCVVGDATTVAPIRMWANSEIASLAREEVAPRAPKFQIIPVYFHCSPAEHAAMEMRTVRMPTMPM